MDTIRLFVYGTLKRGMASHALLADQGYLGTARTVARYRLYDCGRYPGLVEASEGGRAIDGELWCIDENVLPKLDAYEGVPHLFRRGPIALQAVEELILAYFYVRDVTGFSDCGNCWPSLL